MNCLGALRSSKQLVLHWWLEEAFKESLDPRGYGPTTL